MATTSLVTQVTGQAWVRGADGALNPLRQGMRVPADAEIVTATGGSVQLQADGLPLMTIGENRDVQMGPDTAEADVDPSTAAVAAPADPAVAQVLAALNDGADPFENLDPTAAVVQGGSGGDGGSSFTRLVGIVETTTPLGLEYPRPGTPGVEDVRLGGTGGSSTEDDEAVVQVPLPTLTIEDLNAIEAGQITIAEDAAGAVSGSFTISAAAGLAFLTVGNTTLTAAQLNNIAANPVTIQTANGTITLTGFDPATGKVSYEYSVDGAQDHSGGDDSVNDIVPITVTDSSGRQVTDNLGIHITDTNPTAQNDDGGQLVEDAAVGEISGNVTGNDTAFDGPGNVSWAGSENAAVLAQLAQYGDIVLGNDGTWSFTLDNAKPAVQALAEGQVIDFSINYVLTDADGDSVQATLSFSIKGSNDTPVITSGAQSATITEITDNATGENATEHAANGTITFTDVDTLDTHSASVQAQGNGYLGTLVLGSVDAATKSVDWDFTVEDSVLDSLAAGQTLTQDYVVTVADGHGGTVTQTVTITIVGTNDVPVITSDDQQATITEIRDNRFGENWLPHLAGGVVRFDDVDTTDRHTASVQPQGNNYLGTLVLTPVSQLADGVGWGFTVNDGQLDFLAAGETLIQKYDVTIDDGNGGTATQTIVITIVGTNDAPVITSAVQSATITEIEDGKTDENAAEHAATGAITFADVDLTDEHTATFTANGNGYLGTLVLGDVDQAGNSVGWDFKVQDSVLDSLAAGQTLTQTYTVTISDGHGGKATQTITITIVGTNDAPLITSTVQAAAITEVEDGKAGENATEHAANGAITFADVDLTDEHTATFTANGNGYLGTLVLGNVDQAGNSVGWDFKVQDSVLDSLAAGQTLTQTYTVTISDGKGGTATQDITITITGTNDAPVISGPDTGAVQEDGALTAQGQLTVADVDTTDTHTWSIDGDGQGTYGSFALDATGKWVYTLDNTKPEVQALNAGDTRTETFTVLVDDGNGGIDTQLVTITVHGADDSGSVTVDAGTGNDAGKVYEAALDDADDGRETTTGTISVSSTDGIATVTIGGTEYALGDWLNKSVDTGEGTLTITSVTPAADGKSAEIGYSYTLKEAQTHDKATSDDQITDTIAVTVDGIGGSSASGNITISIVDDVPVAHAIDAGSVTEDTADKTVGGDVTADAGNAFGADGEHATTAVTWGDTVTATLGGVTVNLADYGNLVRGSDGTWSFNLDNTKAATQQLQAGQSIDVSFGYSLTDADGDVRSSTVSFQIHGADDGGSVTVDAGAGNDAGKVYEAALDDADDGRETTTGTISVSSTDGIATVTIGGTEYALGDWLNKSVDTGEGMLTITSVTPAAGGKSAEIGYSYTLKEAQTHDKATSDDQITDTIAVTVDGIGGSTASGNITISIVDDVPVANAIDAGSITEDTADTTVGGDVTADAGNAFGADGEHATTAVTWGDTVTATLGGASVDLADYGSLEQNPDGTWSFTLDNTKAATQQLAAGQSIDVSFGYSLTDADGDVRPSTVSFQIHGANDAPIITSAPAVATVSEEGLPTGIEDDDGSPADTTNSAVATGQVTFTDADTAASNISVSLTVPATEVKSHGTAVQWGLSQDGQTLLGTANGQDVIKVTIDDAGNYKVEVLGPVDHPDTTTEDVISLNVGVVVSDGAKSASTTITINIEDDSPKVVQTDVVAVTSTGIPDVYTGMVSFADGADQNGQVLTFANGAVEVSAKGFKAEDDLTLVAADVVKDSNGLGVDSVGPYFPIPGEVDFRKTADDSASEELTIRLTGGKVAYGAKIGFADMFGGELERGVAEFYRDGVLIATQEFSSDQSSGNYAANFVVEEGGFDTIVLKALDNGKSHTHNDNSDFTVTSVEFLGTSEVKAFASAEGTLNYQYGADGAGDIALTGVEGGLKTWDGRDVTSTLVSDNLIQGRDSSGALVYEIRLTPATGKWELFQYQHMAEGDDGKIDFTFKVTDADGDGQEGMFQVAPAAAPVDLPPTIEADSTNLSEANVIGQGSTSVSGAMNIGDPDTPAAQLEVSLVITPEMQGMTSGGAPIVWATSNGGHTLEGSAGGQVVVKVTIDDAGRYDVTLSGPVDHGQPGQDTLGLNVGVQVSDGNTTTDSTLTINIQDDVPVASPYADQTEIQTVNTNILLMIDVSGSMGTPTSSYPSGVWENGVQLTRLEVAKRAIAAMLDKYDDLGDVKVRVVTFSSSGSQKGGAWLSVDDAMDYINGLSANGGTNYDAALNSATSAWGSNGKIPGANNVSYFFSDGAPSSNSDGINSTEQTAWENFLKGNDINSYAIGMGTNVNEGNLKPIAYDGVNNSNNDAANVILVDNFNDLADRISGTVGSPTVQGGLISGSLTEGAHVGADGGYVQSITIDGVTYTYNPDANTVSASGGASAGVYNASTHTLTITTGLDAKFVINLDTGAFTHTGATQTGADQFNYTVADGDGDSASSTLTITVTGPVAPDAVNDHIITNILSSQITIDSAVLLANDQPGTAAQPLGDVTVNTGWLGADFTRSSVRTYDFDTPGNQNGNKALTVARNQFSKSGQPADRAQVKVDGYLAKSDSTNGNNIDIITVALVAGERLTLDHDLSAGWIKMEYKAPGGNWTAIDDGSFIDAQHSGDYEIRITNIQDPGSNHWLWGWQPGSTGAEDYLLTMTVDYSNAQVVNPADAHDSYTLNGAAGSDSADITVSYQAGNTLQGTDGHDTLLAGSGNDTLIGGKGDDILIGGKGNDTMTGGEGDDTFLWLANDQGSTSHFASDTITDFGLGGAKGNDVLDLSDLLVGEQSVGRDGQGNLDLDGYLHLAQNGADTVIKVNTQGNLGANGSNADQQIILKDVDLADLAGSGNQNEMIKNLIDSGKLNVDQ